MKHKKKLGRPYKLSLTDHRELIRRKAAGQSVAEIAVAFGLNVHTIYEYVKLDPATRRDA